LKITRVKISFQGGFVAKQCSFYVVNASVANDSKNDINESQDNLEMKGENAKQLSFRHISQYNPEDSNKEQTFEVNADDVIALKVHMAGSSDFYGRIVIYKMDIFGLA
jgi:hypothetical protein